MLEIPTDWLMPGLDLDAVREAQRPDSTATLTSGTAGSVSITTATTQSPTAAEVPVISVDGALPPGLTFADNHDGTATLTGTPTTAGTYQVTVRASNAVSPTATQSLVITVG